MKSLHAFCAKIPRIIFALTFVLPLFNPTSAAASATTLESEGASQSVEAGQVPEGLTSADWESIQTAISADQNAFSKEGNTATAHNPTQNWDLSFGAEGLSVPPIKIFAGNL